MRQCKSATCSSFAVNIDPDNILCDVCFYRAPLTSLLAIIHRDGGHYEERYGTKKASIDAEEKVCLLLAKTTTPSVETVLT